MPSPGADVTAVLVAHDGAHWLPEALAALAASTVQPAQVLLVDTGSTDGSADLLRMHGEPLSLPADSGYGAAVQAALASAASPSPTTWLWLLHDDAAPEPDALGALLAYAQDSPSAALLGPKVLDWDDPRLLVEVGLTTDTSGHRDTGLERREYDQGQRDDIRDVLAVGTAGALVRRDVWDEIGGLDPLLPVYRDDLDLGWRVNAAGHRVVVVPQARLRHARAATTGQRHLGAVSGRPGGIDRKHALFVLLAHASAPALLLAVPRLILSCLARAVGFVLTRQVLAARDELLALGALALQPARLVAARRGRARTRSVPHRAVRPLLAARTDRLRARAEAVGGWLAGGQPVAPDPMRALGDPGPEGPDELADLVPSGPGLLSRLLLRPAVLLVLTAALLALAAQRSVLAGGSLFGGRLLPVAAGATDLWASYAASWHPVSLGSAAAAHPSVGVLAALSTLLLGKAWLAVDLLLLGSVPLAAATAYAAARHLTKSFPLRLWVAATWALLPVATGAIREGRLDLAVVQIALPLLLTGATAALRPEARWRQSWAVGLGLAVTAAFAPLLWPVAAAGLVVGGLLVRSIRRLAAALVIAATPAVLLLPWALEASRSAWLDGPGRTLASGDVPGWQLLLLAPSATWIAVGLVLAALGALLCRTRHDYVLAGWVLALIGLVLAAFLDRTGHAVGLGLQLSAAGMLVAAVVGADGLPERLAQSSFGWRQVAAVGLAVTAVATPLLAALSWVADGADNPLQRGARPVLPAFARAELAAEPGLRLLVVRPGPTGISYDVSTAGGPRLGDADTPSVPAQRRALDEVVTDLLTARGSDAADALATRAVRYVALVADARSGPVASALDAQPGLTRRASGEVLLWRVVAPTGRLTVVPGPTAGAALRDRRAPTVDQLRTAPPRPFPAGQEAADLRLGPGRPGRIVVLAEATDPGWRATYDGAPLPRRTAWGWAQAFELPAVRGVLRIDRDNGPRRQVLLLQGVGLVVVLVLAGPGARSRRGLEVVDP